MSGESGSARQCAACTTPRSRHDRRSGRWRPSRRRPAVNRSATPSPFSWSTRYQNSIGQRLDLGRARGARDPSSSRAVVAAISDRGRRGRVRARLAKRRGGSRRRHRGRIGSCTVAAHCSGEPVADGASHSSGISVATCSSSSVVAVASSAPRKPATKGSARNRASTAGSQPFVFTIRSPYACRYVARRPTVFLSRTSSGRWSPTVAEHDHTSTDAGSRPGLVGGLLHRLHAAHERLVGEERVQHDLVERAAAEGEAVRPERHESERDVLVEVGIEAQERIAAGGTVVADDRLALPEPAHQPGEVLELRGGRRLEPERPHHRVDAAAEPEREPAAGQPMHRRRVRRGDDRMASVDVRRPGGDLDARRHGADRAGQRRGLLDVEPLADEDQSRPRRSPSCTSWIRSRGDVGAPASV